MGAFDDLIPTDAPTVAGAFDDLIPRGSASRGAGQIAKDSALAVTSGAAGVAKPITMLLDRVRTGEWIGPATKAVDQFQDSQQAGKSEQLQEAARAASERTARRGRMVSDALGDENLAARLLRQTVEFGSGAVEALKNPDLLLDQTLQMGPMMKATQAAGRATQAVATPLAKALPARAAEVVGRGAGTAGAVAAGAGIQGADVGTEAYQRLLQLPDEVWAQNPEFQRLAADIGSAQAKERIAQERAASAAAQGGAISLATAALPGGSAIERALVQRRMPSSAASIARAAGGEFASEGLEEGGGRLAQNVAVAGVDPNQDVLQGVGEAGGQGSAMGGLVGGGATAVRQGLTVYADRQGKVPKAPPAAPPVSSPAVPAVPAQSAAAPDSDVMTPPEVASAAPAAVPDSGVMSDPLAGPAAELVRSTGKASLPQLQRHLRIPYKRAADLLAQLETAGVVSAKNEEGGRTVLPWQPADPNPQSNDASQIEATARADATQQTPAGQAPAPAGSDAAGAGADGIVPGAGTATLEADGLTSAPSSNAAGQDINMQNRDRSTAASVAQMMTIAKNPDYGRLGLSRTPDAGAPMVYATGNDTMKIAPDAFGGADVATMSDGQRVPFRYAVVSADQVEASHFADGRVNPAFSQDVLGTLKALNNGRTAGVRASYEMGAAGNYRAELERDAPNLGIDPAVIARTRNPMLVRVYDESANTAGMAAKSQAQGEALSVPEQAASDAPLIDAGLLQSYQGGGLDLTKNVDFVRGFVQRLQASGQPIGKMMQSDGRLSAEGLTRLNAALMQVAYSDTGIVEKFFASTDGDMKGIGAALKDVAADWAVMRTRALNGELPADVDVTGNLLQALRLIEQARSQGQSIYDMANQVDLETGEAPDALTVNLLGLFFTGHYFTRPAGQSTLQGRLQRYIQAASATSAEADMFGEVVTRDDILTTILAKDSLNDFASQSTQQAPAPQGEREPERGSAAGDAAAAGGRRGSGQQREGARQGAAASGAIEPGGEDDQAPARGEAGGQGYRQAAGDEVSSSVNEPDANYQPDLFGGPLELLGQSVPQIPGRSDRGGPSAPAEPGNLDAASGVPGDTPIPAGEFYVNTLIGIERQRSLGADRIGSLADLARATQYLYRSAIERFDGIVTDAAGKPLAVVGGFKGGLAQANVHMDTLVGEAVRVPGAAQIWFSHNHPSGMPDLSSADLALSQHLATVFSGSGIEPQGLIAVGRGQFQGVSATGERESGAVSPPTGRTDVPAIERQLSDLREANAPAVESPADAMRLAQAFHAKSGNGLMLFDSRLRLAGWLPVPNQPEQLRGGPGLNAIYRAISQANAASGIVVHDGSLDGRLRNAATVAENLGGALRLGGARSLDIINVKTRESAASRGLEVDSNTVLSRASAETAQTPEFKRWFGDSKIVDAAGAPRVMFHGTARDITTFRPKQADAIFVTDDPEFAAQFSANSEYWMLERGLQDGAQNILPVFVKASDPFDFADRMHVADVADWMMERFAQEERDGIRRLPPSDGLSREPLSRADLVEVLRGDLPDNWRAVEHPWTQQAIRALGFDAFYVREEGRKNLAVYEPTQLKSAIGNNGQFDASNPDIRYSRGDDGRGIPLQQLQDLADRVAKRLPNAPPIEVLDSPRDAPMALRLHILAAQAFNDAEGAVHDGRIYMFARNLSSLDRAEHVLAEHEIAHAGLRAVLGSRRTQAMQMLANLNPALRQEAARKAQTLGLSLTAALEEVLVDMPTADLPRLKGWQRFLEMLADGLERLGLASAAATLRGASEAQALQLAGDLIRAARDHAAGRSDATARGVRAADRLAAIQRAGEQRTAEVGGAAPALSSSQVGPAEPMREARTFEEARAAAKDFMGQDLVNAETGMVARVSRNSLDKMLSSKAVGKSETPAIHSLAVANADTLFQRALFGWVKPDAKGDPNITVHRFFAPLKTPDGTVIVKLTVKETRRADQPNPLYTVEAVDLNEETPAAQWVDSTVRADGLDPTSIRSAGDVRSLAEWVQANNEGGEAALSRAGQPPGAPPPTTQGLNRSAGWKMAEDSLLDNFVYEIQDKLVDTKRALEAIREQQGQVQDELDPYLQEELFHGRAAKQTQDFLQSEVRPLLIELAKSGIGMPAFEKFLHARHAEERNAQIASINPDMPDGGSGMSTADARQLLANLPPARRKQLDQLAAQLDDITAGTRQYLVDSGLESAETVKAWQDAYQHYVPLQRADMDGDGSLRGTGAGFSVRGSSTKRAMGSERAVENILANVVMQRERAITRGEKNRVARALYGLAIKAPNKGFWAAVNPDANGRTPAEQKRLEAELIDLGLSPADAASVLIEPKQRYVDPSTGLVEERINPAARAAGNVLAVRVNGQDRFVFFNERDPRAARMVTALKNLDAAQLGAVMQLSAKITRYFSAINTAYNPVFGMINLTRDVQAAMLNLSTTEIAGHELEVAKQLPAAMKGIMQSLRARRDGGTANGAWSKLFDEFEESGGRTGYRDMYATAQDRGAELEKELKRASNGEGMVAHGWRAMLDLLNDYNDTMENSVRLAAFKVAREQGLSDDQAASLAKNLTVNFNRKGNVTTQVGALYAFFNASVQGTARLAQTMRGPLGKRILVGGMLLGAMQALLLAAAGFDDDQPPEFIRERNFIIPIGDGKYIAIPMPLGFHVIPNLTRIPTEWALGGFKEASRRIVDLVGIIAGAFNPIGSAGMSVQTLAPTVLDPLVALSENRDFAGRPIAKEDFGNRETPGFTRKRDTSSWISTTIAEGINWISGGTDFKPGAFSPTPDQLDYLFGQVTGGVGRELNKAYTTADSFRTGDELPAYKIPLFGRLYGDTKEAAAVSGTYYNNLRELRLHAQELKGRKETRQDTKAYLADNPEAKLAERAKKTEKVVSNLRKLRRDLVEKDAPAARIKAVDQRMQREMEQLNEAVRAAKKATSAPAR